MNTYTEEEIKEVLGRYLASWLVADLMKELDEVAQLREPVHGPEVDLANYLQSQYEQAVSSLFSM